MPSLDLERAFASDLGITRIAGVDEVGRGPWAGPVIACAVLLPDIDADHGGLPPALFDALDDSKRLSEARREEIDAALLGLVDIGFGEASVAEIDELNILQASLLAMRRAVAALPNVAQAALVDGNKDPGLGIPTQTIVKGDSRSASIAAASIFAKVRRDRLMCDLDREFPFYAWASNKGYGTKAHQVGLENHGICEHHRKSFAPIRDRLSTY